MTDAGAASTLRDGRQNGDETGIDCGGSNPAKCGLGQGCQGGGDCASTSCVQRACRNVSSSNGVKDGTETDVDCGGAGNAPKCGGDKACGASSDCISAVCSNSKCAPPNATDGIKNGDETDVDCGGSGAPACAASRQCAVASDCGDAICTANRCVLGTNVDGVKNAGESGTDCGGSAPQRCNEGFACSSASDCAERSCVANLCAAPTYTDGAKNGAETDVDCGGDGAPPCADNKTCAVPRDCSSTRCVGQICAPASHSDGVLNLGESDVDCGGAQADVSGQAPRCEATKVCAGHSDCASDGCNADTLRCALARSCAQVSGGETCGKGETNTPATKVHESCCTPVPFTRPAAQGGNFAVDKYIITAGRMRQFLDRTGGNVRAYMESSARWNEYNAKWGTALTDHLPTNVAQAEAIVARGSYQTWEWEGDQHKLPTTDPNYAAYAISGYGCYDAHTYHQAGDPYTRSFTDEKALNCAQPMMLDALCMWDGGKLWEDTMATYVWNGGSGNNRSQPWGNSPVPQIYPARYSTDPTNPVHEYLVHKWNYPYVGSEFGELGVPYMTNGNAYQIPPPGRRPKGYARDLGVSYNASNPLVGVADIAGVVFQMAWRKSANTLGTLNSGSYEVHDQGTYGSVGGWAMARRYAAAGARCAR